MIKLIAISILIIGIFLGGIMSNIYDSLYAGLIPNIILGGISGIMFQMSRE